MKITLHALSEDGLNERTKHASKNEARGRLRMLQRVCWRELTAEMIDKRGEVLESFERGQWTVNE